MSDLPKAFIRTDRLGSAWRFMRCESSPRRAAVYFIVSLVLAIAAVHFALSLGVIPFVGAPPVGLTTVLGSAALVAVTLPAVALGLRYFFSTTTTISVLGVVLGVGTITLALAVGNGFHWQMRHSLEDVNAHVTLMKLNGAFGLEESLAVLSVVKNIDDDVVAAQPFVFIEVRVRAGDREVPGFMKGINPELAANVMDIDKHVVGGAKLQDVLRVPANANKARPVVIAQSLAAKLGVAVGDRVTLAWTGDNEEDALSPTDHVVPPPPKEFRVTGLFHSGFDFWDQRLLFVRLSDAQQVQGGSERITGIEVKVRDSGRAEIIARRIGSTLGLSTFIVMDWRSLNRDLFTAIAHHRKTLVPWLFALLVVAIFFMLLAMVAFDKTGVIAVTRTRNATPDSVRVFGLVGVFSAALGTTLGLAIGTLLAWALDNYRIPLDQKTYLIDHVPASVSPLELLLLGCTAMIIAGLATLPPRAIVRRAGA